MKTLLHKKQILVSLVILAFIFFSCGEEPSNPSAFDPQDFPAAPINVKASVGDGVIKLSWFHPNVKSVRSYNVYRQDSSSTKYDKIGSTEDSRFTDNNLQNHRVFRYRVSALSINGLEGKKSAIVSGIPAIFGVTINLGDEFATSRSVNLTLTAPTTAAFMKISNDLLSISDARWERFVPTRNWTLSFSDGKKTVYVQFRDSEDRETIKPYSDDIILDSEAVIEQVSEDSNGRILTSEDSIHFVIVANEQGGKSWVNVQGVAGGITLFDDGKNGDAISDDGVYEALWKIPVGPEIESSLVTGHFTDKAGNVAETLNAPSRITIRRKPHPVTLIQVVSPSETGRTSLNLFWTSNSDMDFASYRIFRSNVGGVDTKSQLVTIIQDQTVNNYTDVDLEPNTTYYYRVYVFDRTGLSNASNEGSGTTISDSPPNPVKLIQIRSINTSSNSLELFWRSNTDADFNNYTIFRSSSPGVTTESSLVTILQDQSVVSFVDTELEPNTTYYYRIFVFDFSGLSASSNELSGTTVPVMLPSSVNIIQVRSLNSSSTSLEILWTPNSDADFNNYALFRSLTTGVTIESSLVSVIYDQPAVSFVDTDLNPNTTYHYRVFVFNSSGLLSGSNELSGTTNPNYAPTPINLSLPVQTDSLTLRLSWSQSEEKDFASYRLYRSNLSPVDTTSALVIFNNDAGLTQYDDNSIEKGVIYFYRIFVFDKFGLSTGSNEVSGSASF